MGNSFSSDIHVLTLALPWSGKGKCLLDTGQDPIPKPPRTKQNGDQLLLIPGKPRSGWMEGAGAGWNRSPLTGDWLSRNQPCSISLLSPAWVTSLSTEHLHRPRPDGELSKSAFCSVSALNTGDSGLGKGMHFFLHWAFIIYFFLLDDIPAIKACWRHLGRWQDNILKIWGREQFRVGSEN